VWARDTEVRHGRGRVSRGGTSGCERAGDGRGGGAGEDGAQGDGRGGGRGGGRLAMHAVLHVCTEAFCRLKPLLTQLADLNALSDVTFSIALSDTI